MRNLRFLKDFNPLFTISWNIVLAYLCFFLCRVVFLLENYSYFSENMSFGHLVNIFGGGMMFDTAAILYLNSLYLVMMLLPFHFRENKVYASVTKWAYLLPNLAAVIMNLCDTVYFQYTNRRTTATFFAEFSNENNLAGIFFKEMINHWYLLLFLIVVAWGMFKLYRKVKRADDGSALRYYLLQIVSLAVVVPLVVGGIRGGFTRATRPITLSNANQYVSRPLEAAIVLNTPFSILRTIGKTAFVVPEFFTDREEMEALYTPVHMPADSAEFRPMNVVIFIMESFGAEYTGFMNRDLKGADYGYTPFLDSLAAKGLVWECSYANGRKSIDGMPSVLSGIPMFIEPFFLTPSSLNEVSSVAGELAKKGYYTAFFHGADNSSMGFQAFARSVGFQDYFGRTEYGNDADFDGNWAIWDREFFQFYKKEMDKMQQPFVTALFSASSHHPYNIPVSDKGKYPEGTLPIHKCIGYTDNALKEFFEAASQSEWYDNTLFVITADHTNQSDTPEYMTDAGVFSVPVVFFQPSDTSLVGRRSGIAQQIDIMPTVLSYLGYDRPYVSFGCDLLTTPSDETFAVNYAGGIYQYFKNDYLLQFDGTRSTALYDLKQDRLLHDNLLSRESEVAAQMEMQLKSIIQQYMERMTTDALVYRQ